MQQRSAVNSNFPTVCVGGPAGGLDAYMRLLRHLPADMGLAIVIVNRITMAPTMLRHALAHIAPMPVELIENGMAVVPDRVFVIPSNRDLHIDAASFRLAPVSKPRGWPEVITVFLKSVARSWDGQIVAVIVSGYDDDGADALCGIRDAGGIADAQQLSTARQPDMPESAIATGCIDFILTPEGIAAHFVRIARGDMSAWLRSDALVTVLASGQPALAAS
ncbi:UNVERIFIED_ORG: CheB methylesterase [Zoogloea ramigera]|uniref:protein-glutamate methylesterase n=1 Tax=Duganella zoogloeoides TaxID=75659 RepID=A0ABZ0Y4G3_9BURK|nr:chemotaxis protein CheB [Duganella zoogloeoides]WQH06915.1 chemotaxis protein CheB [Duganella zoogloeoides]